MIAVAVLWFAGILFLIVMWSRDIGLARAVAAGCFRFGWTLPIILSLFPITITKRIPGTVALQPVNILVDDSDSMKLPDIDGGLAQDRVSDLVKRIDSVCIQFGCLPKITMLSDIAPDTKRGFTPLSRVLEPWLYKTGGEPWMLLSDGGDFRPTLSWAANLKDRGSTTSQRLRSSEESKTPSKTLGMVVSFGKQRSPGFSLESILLSPLAFEGKSVQLTAHVDRVDVDSSRVERVQVQVLVDGKVITSNEAEFGPGTATASVDLSFAAPRRGPHIITAKVLPVGGELDLWDNTQSRALDVLPNTVGVLHLLGSPTWDGRFMRRFLKAEPKFDVISFFILRDPWDSQQVGEREMSLIPFPVERLFKEELVNFRVIVMQNFTLMRFLQPEYQENLVKFVKDGGGLLFIGGPRALTETDATSSPLAGLLPFSFVPDSQASNQKINLDDSADDVMGGMGSTWDNDAHFRIEMANPDPSRRALANVYDGWQAMSDRLAAVDNLKGLHKMQNIKFKDQELTPLLNAKLSNGKVVPLAVASYPGKGRALWVFSDSFWRLAMSSNSQNARSDYHAVMDDALSWLTRGDMRSTLSVRDFSVLTTDDSAGKIKWRAELYGSASRYVKSATSLKLSICGVGQPADFVSFGNASGDTIILEGELNASVQSGSLCALKIEVSHPSFGSLNLASWTLIPETIDDKNMGPSVIKLKQLATQTGATFIAPNHDRGRSVEQWLQIWGTSNGKALPDKMKSTRDFYWILEYSWIWILLLLLPFEVVVRRWHLISGNRSSQDDTDSASKT